MTRQRMKYLRGLAEGYVQSFLTPDGYIKGLMESYLGCLRSEGFDSVFAGKAEGEVSVQAVQQRTKETKNIGPAQVADQYFGEFSALVRIGYPNLSDAEIKAAILN